MKQAGKTPPFRGPCGESVPSIAEAHYLVPPETSLQYFDALTAPSKTFVWFEESGHEPFVDEPAKCNAAMVEMVRPSAVVPQ